MTIINGKEYPFDPPTHGMVGDKEVMLTEDEVEALLQEWAIEYDKIEAAGLTGGETENI